MPVPDWLSEAVGVQDRSCPRGVLDPRIGEDYEREKNMLCYTTFLILPAELNVRCRVSDDARGLTGVGCGCILGGVEFDSSTSVAL